MSRYLLRRLAQMLPIALLVATLVFSLLHLIPGDPVEVMLGEGAQAADVAALRAELGLDRPLGEQYLAFLGGLGRFDLGTSLHSGEPVTAVLLAHLPATLELACAAMLVALALSLPLGTLAAFHRGRAADHVSRAVAVLGVALPNFWLGPMLILLFSVQLGWLPVSGREGIASLVLPAVTLGAGLSALLTRLVRASVAEELARPYLATALAKGVSRARAVVVHALRNALVPALTVAALQFGALLTGAIVTETVFSWPGLGRLLIEGIRLRDYPLVQGGVLLIAWTYLVVNLVTDLAYAWLDPRMRESN